MKNCTFFVCSFLNKLFPNQSSILNRAPLLLKLSHDDVIKYKHFPLYWPFVRGIHRSPVNSPHKGQWRGALIFSLIGGWMNDWVNNREQQGPFYLALIPTWMSCYIHYKLWDEITYPFLNINGCTVEVREWILSHFIPHFTMAVIKLYHSGLKSNHVSKSPPSRYPEQMMTQFIDISQGPSH